MDKICRTAREFNVPVVEDSAQAHGTVFQGRRTGSFGTVGVFSFFVAHNIQAGEMGAVVTDDTAIAKRILKLKTNGRLCDCIICNRKFGKCVRMLDEDVDYDFDPRFCHDVIGYNFKTTEFQSAIANLQLKKADWIKEKRLENVKFLNDELGFLSDLELMWTPKFDKDVSYLGYFLTIVDVKLSRRKVRLELERHGIETRPLFGCIPTQQPAYVDYREKYVGKLPNAEYLGKDAFYIGCHQYLTEDDLHYVVEVFKEVFKKA